MIRKLARLRTLRRDRSAVALMEFAISLPMFLVMGVTGSEIANYVTVKMRMSQVALHLADHAARMGSGSLLAAKTISETHINDVLTGAGLQAAELDLYGNGRVILTNVEGIADPNPTDRYRVTWKRCRGSATYPAPHIAEAVGATNLVGVGPTGRKVKVPPGSATMFVEVYYEYQPLFMGDLAPTQTLVEVASMTVRERRDLTRIYNTENAPISRC